MESWCLSDDETLAAALEFLDTFPADGTSTATSSTGSPRIKRSKQQRHLICRGETTSKLKSELQRLRGEVASLEAQYAQLRGRAACGDGVVRSVSLWESVARRQQRRRQEAEVENAKLHEQLEEQVRAARMLERLLKKRCWNQRREDPLLGCRMSGLGRGYDLLSFDQLRAVFQQMMASVDTVFSAQQFRLSASQGAAFSEVELVTRTTNDRTEKVAQQYDARIAPFDAPALASAMWHQILYKDPGNDVLYVNTRVSDDGNHFERESGSATEIPQMKGIFHCKMIGHMLTDGEIPVILWTSVVNVTVLSGDDNKVGANYRLLHQGWSRMQSLPSPDESSGPVTAIQTYQISIPSLDTIPDRRHRTSTMTNYVGSMRVRMDDFWLAIESRVMEHSRQQPSTCAASSPSEPV